MARILSIQLHDFLSIGDAHIDLTEPLGLVLIEGVDRTSTHSTSNGSGKSALVSEPILWCLKGVTLRGATGDSVVRKGSETGTVVRVRLESEGVEYDVTRFQAHKAHGNGIVIVIDGEDATPRSKTEAQRTLDRLIPLTPALLSSILILGEGFENRFASFTNKQKLEFIETLIGDGWDDPLQAARKRQAGLESAIEQGRQQVRNLKQRASDLLDLAEREASARERDLVGYRKRYDELVAEVAERTMRGAPPDPDYLAHLQDQLQAAQVNIAEARGTLRRWESQRAKLAALSSEVECPTCFQSVAPEYVKDTLVSVGCEIERWTVEVDQHGAAGSRLETALTEARRLRDEHHANKLRLGSLTGEMKLVSETIEKLESTPVRSVDPAELEKLQGGIVNWANYISEKEAELPYAAFWSAGFTAAGVRSFRTDGILQWLNERLEYYCELLYDGTVMVRLLPQRALKSRKGLKNEITIEATFPGSDYFTASRGERRKADLALHLALQDLAIRVSGFEFNLLVADEVLDSLDRESITRALKLLEQRASEVGTVFLVTHEEGLRSQVPTAWTVIKEEGVSRLER